MSNPFISGASRNGQDVGLALSGGGQTKRLPHPGQVVQGPRKTAGPGTAPGVSISGNGAVPRPAARPAVQRSRGNAPVPEKGAILNSGKLPNGAEYQVAAVWKDGTKPAKATVVQTTGKRGARSTTPRGRRAARAQLRQASEAPVLSASDAAASGAIEGALPADQIA